jgi:hypothetical protein
VPTCPEEKGIDVIYGLSPQFARKHIGRDTT